MSVAAKVFGWSIAIVGIACFVTLAYAETISKWNNDDDDK